MISLSPDPFAPSDPVEELVAGITELQQAKILSRWLGLSACLKSSTPEEAQLLKHWAAVENHHVELLALHANLPDNERKVTDQSPLRLARDILQQDGHVSLSHLFFQSLIGLKRWEAEQAKKLQQIAASMMDQTLLLVLKKFQLEDNTIAEDIIALCDQSKRGSWTPDSMAS